MANEMIIYPRRCASEGEKLQQLAGDMERCMARLEQVKRTVGAMHGSSYAGVVSTLTAVIDEISNEKKSLNSLQQVLDLSVQLYEQTEKRIAGTQGLFGAVNDAKDFSDGGKSWDTILGDVLGNIGDVRNIWWESLIESAIGGITDKDTLKALEQIAGGTYLTSYWKNGKIYFKLHQNGLTNREITNWLRENLGGSWDKYRAKILKKDGLSVYDANSGRYTKDLKYFKDINDTDVAEYIKKFDDGMLKTTFKENFKIFDDFNYKEFKEAGKLGKAGKILGAAGTVLTIGSDVVDNFYDSDTGQWSFSQNQLADCVCDVGIDVASDAAFAAIGAAVGSLIVPPVGTVVGAGVGIAIGVVANNVGIYDIDGDGKKDDAITIFKTKAHEAVDAGEKLIDNVTDWGSKAVNQVGDWLGSAFAF